MIRECSLLTACAFAPAICLAEPTDRGFEHGEVQTLYDQPLAKDGHIDLGPLDPMIGRYFETKAQFGRETGFNYVIENRLINQWAPGTSIYDNELNLIARWEFHTSETFGTSSINTWGQFAQSIGGQTGSDFQGDLGVLSPLNGGNGGPSSTNEILQMLAVEQIALNGKFRAQVGKLALRTLVNLNRYANGDSEMFFSPMLGNNPVVPYTALLGLGAFAQYKEDSWYVSGLVRAPDTELGFTFDTIGDGDFEYLGEVALTPTIAGLGYGEYRFTLSYLEQSARFDDTVTFSASIDQDIGERFGVFFRVAHADDTFRDFETRVAAGFQIKTPFDFSFDRLGAGVWWGDPNTGGLNDEYGFELFYKAQVTRFLELTPDFQLVVDPALSDDAVEAVVGFRLRVAL